MSLQESIRRILREYVLNETTFFRRRVNLSDVRNSLNTNSWQVFQDTENYRQFKYELTLRAVESILWNDYAINWEDLPEQEEIEFVTKVSNMIEKDIKSIYDSHKQKS